MSILGPGERRTPPHDPPCARLAPVLTPVTRLRSAPNRNRSWRRRSIATRPRNLRRPRRRWLVQVLRRTGTSKRLRRRQLRFLRMNVRSPLLWLTLPEGAVQRHDFLREERSYHYSRAPDYPRGIQPLGIAKANGIVGNVTVQIRLARCEMQRVFADETLQPRMIEPSAVVEQTGPIVFSTSELCTVLTRVSGSRRPAERLVCVVRAYANRRCQPAQASIPASPLGSSEFLQGRFVRTLHQDPGPLEWCWIYLPTALVRG